MSMATEVKPEDKKNELMDSILKIEGRIRAAFESGMPGLSRGDVSDLRRMDISFPANPFWKAAGDVIPQGRDFRGYALICKCMAIMAPNIHRQGRRLGIALCEAGYSSSSDIKLNRLLKAEGEQFEDLLVSACRYLAGRGEHVDWVAAARFALARDAEQRKPFSIRVAQDFFSNPKAA